MAIRAEKYIGDALRLLGGQGLVLLAAMLTNLLMARTLGVVGRGEVALVLQISYVLAVFCALGRDRAYPVCRPGTPLKEGMRAQLALLIGPALICVVCSIVTGILIFDGATAGAAIFGVFGVTLGAVVLRYCRAASIAAADSSSLVRIMMVTQVLLIMGATALWVADCRSVEVFMALYGAVTFAPYMLFLMRWRKFALAAPLSDVKRQGLRYLPASLAEMLMMRLDRLLIPVFASVGGLGYYVVVATMTELAAWPGQQYADSKSPVWAQRGLSRRGIVSEVLVALTITSVICVGVGSATWVLVEPLFGSEFRPGRELIFPLCIAAAATACYRVIYCIAVSLGRVGTVNLLTGIALALSAFTYPIAIRADGPLGAAWASAAVFSATSGIGLILLLLGLRPTWFRRTLPSTSARGAIND